MPRRGRKKQKHWIMNNDGFLRAGQTIRMAGGMACRVLDVRMGSAEVQPLTRQHCEFLDKLNGKRVTFEAKLHPFLISPRSEVEVLTEVQNA